MEKHRLALILCLCAQHVFATGDFYEDPIYTLPEYLALDQLPAKTFEQIHRETAAVPPAAPAREPKTIMAEVLQLAGKGDAATSSATIEKLLVEARLGQAQHGPGLANLLHDIADLFAAKAPPAEAAEYIRWRAAHSDRFGFQWDDAKSREYDSGEKRQPEVTTEIATRLAAASPAVKPHWLYLRGAFGFKRGEDKESQTWFDRVVKEHPGHPRAEAAAFMSARCALSQSRVADDYQNNAPGYGYAVKEGPRLEAQKRLQSFLDTYPQSRFAGDAIGWLGAAAYDAHDYVKALTFYLRQCEVPGHPEYLRSASEMVAKCLSWLISAPDDKAFAEIAKQPLLAQSLVYLAVNTSESDNFNGGYDDAAETVGWRKGLLPRLAAAIAKQEKSFAAAPWTPRYAAMLALAASGAGDQEQALRLLALGGEAGAQNDDAAFARCVVLGRSKKAAETVGALRAFEQRFPQSPLLPGARLRLAMALIDDHQGGEAALVLASLATPPAKSDDDYAHGPATGPIYAVEVKQVAQILDAILNYAPPAELAAVLTKPGLGDEAKLPFKEVLAQRHLAKEQFDDAKKYLTAAQWKLSAAKLEQLTRDAKATQPPPAHAAACAKLADAWAAARGKLLTYPLDTDERRKTVFDYNAQQANRLRAASAAALGFTGNLHIELENRDELRHAFNWWIEASDAVPNAPANAPLIWKALRAMPLIADVSTFSVERAAAKNWSGVSRKLHERLRKEHPDSEETKRRAVYYDFPARVKGEGEEEGEWYRDLAGQDLPGDEVFDSGGESDDGEGKGEALAGRILSLEHQANAEPARLKPLVAALRTEARKTFRALRSAFWINYLDDLALFLAERDPGADVRQRYFELRTRCLETSAFGFWKGLPERNDKEGNALDLDSALREKIEAALTDPKMKAIADYLEFLDAAVVANQFIDVEFEGADKDGEAYTYRSRDYSLLAEKTSAFLAKHPKSRKREAALLLHARALYHSSRPTVFKKEVTWPAAPRWEGGYLATVQQLAPFEPKRILAALDQYDREFPRGLYAAEIRDYRAAVALRQHEWKSALEWTLAQLDDSAKPGLQVNAANRLGQLFAQLADERHRADILAAIKPGKRARERLGEYLDYDSDIHPLASMKTWMREQIGAKPGPGKKKDPL